MNLHLALTATQAGAAIASQTGVLSISHDPATRKCDGVVVLDNITGQKFKIKVRA